MGEPLIVIGNGMAAARLVEELAKRALGRYAVAVIGEEPRLAYNRVLLSALLAREVGFAEIELKPAQWWRDRGVTLRYGMRASAVDPVERELRLSSGTRLSFSKLVFATGSQPVKLDVAGMDLPGVFTFRDIDDVKAIAQTAGKRVVVTRRRAPRARSGAWPRQSGRARHGAASHGQAHGAPARCAGSADAQARGRREGHCRAP
jgi:nitrite reductase (NADH) large subunit